MSATWPLVVLGTIAVVEAVLRLPLLATAKRLLSVVRRVLQVLPSRRISDHWKEKALLSYAVAMLRNSLLLFGLLLLAFAPLVLVALAGDWIGAPVTAALLGPVGLIATLVVASAYVAARMAILRRV